MFEQVCDEEADGARTRTTIWQELDEWGKSLPDWQRFIVSHAVRDGVLNDEKVDETFRLFLRSNSLDSSDKALPAIPSTVTGREAVSASNIVLKNIHSLSNVNAIPTGTSLTFGPELTVIYGHNGAGKSGFARLMSAACFCRAEQKVIGNIYSEEASAPATARFVLEQEDGSEEEITFTDGNEHDELRRISIFDSSVAHIHLSKENPLVFQPTGFDVFSEMTRVIELLTTKLDADIQARTKPNEFHKLFSDPGPVAHALQNLTATTDIAELRSLGTFGETEVKRLEEVAKQEAELLAKSPAETLKVLATAKADIALLQGRIIELQKRLGHEACKYAVDLLRDHSQAMINLIEAGSQAVSHEAFSQTGTDKWDAFVNSSRALGKTESSSYPEPGSPCLLCHRPLDEPSATLISRLWKYLDHTARITANKADKAVNDAIGLLSVLETNLLPEDSRARADISKVDPGLVAQIDLLSAAFSARRNVLIGLLKDAQVDEAPSGDIEVPETVISKSLLNIEDQETALQKGDFNGLVENLRTEHIALRQGQVLSKNIDDVAAFVSDLAWVKKAEKSRPNSRFITAKQRALFQSLIEGEYKNRLAEECGKLDCSPPYEFKARGSAGQTLRGLKAQGGHKPQEIFSEGEQRALSLADFLTEISLNPTSAAIVLDDPVTSLDHQRKASIAKRLVEEAVDRQVIVFTHDLVFLSLLTENAEKYSRALTGHWVESLDGTPGYINHDESPANSRVYRTTKKAKEFLADAKSSSGRERVDLVRSGAGALRRTIEEVVIFHLFKDTVRRWTDQIRLGTLSKINWSEEIADEIVELQGETSRLLEGHSNSDEFSAGMPDTDSLQSLIARVDAVIAEAKKARP